MSTDYNNLRKRAEAFMDAWGADGQWIQPEEVIKLLEERDALRWLVEEARWWAGDDGPELYNEYADRIRKLPWGEPDVPS